MMRRRMMRMMMMITLIDSVRSVTKNGTASKKKLVPISDSLKKAKKTHQCSKTSCLPASWYLRNPPRCHLALPSALPMSQVLPGCRKIMETPKIQKKQTRRIFLWGKEKKKPSGNPQGEREFTYPSCGSVGLLLGRFPSGVPMKHPIEAKFSQGNFPLRGVSVVKWLSLFWEDPEIIAFDISQESQEKNGIWRIYSHNNLLIRYFPAILNNPQLWPSPKKRRWSLTTGVFFRSLPRPLGHAWMKRHVGCPTWQRPGLVSTSNCLIGILEMGCYNPNIPWVGWHPLSTLTNQGFLFSLLASPLCLNKHIAMEKSTTLSPNIYKYHQKNGGWFYDVILTSTYRV